MWIFVYNLLQHYSASPNRHFSLSSSVPVEEIARNLLRLWVLLRSSNAKARTTATHKHMVLTGCLSSVLLHLRLLLLLLLLLHSLLLLVVKMDIQTLRRQIHDVRVVLNLISEGWRVSPILRRRVCTGSLPWISMRLLLALHMLVGVRLLLADVSSRFTLVACNIAGERWGLHILRDQRFTRARDLNRWLLLAHLLLRVEGRLLLRGTWELLALIVALLLGVLLRLLQLSWACCARGIRWVSLGNCTSRVLS